MDATGGGLFDVAIVGLGPAGRALASRCAGAGLTVLAVDPAPDAVWRQTLSLWADQVPPWLHEDACGTDILANRVYGPAMYSPERAVLEREYAVLDTGELHAALPLGPGVTVERDTLDDSGVLALTERAHRVVDCRGAGGQRNRGPLQTAFGIVVDADAAAPALGGESALFMDWRSDHDDDEAGPGFLYAIPVGPDRVLLEETCLAGWPAPKPAVLETRLRSRLRRRGMGRAALDRPLAVERVRIPLAPRPRYAANPRVEAFGTAGGYGHAATGYSVAAALGAVPGAVVALGTGRPIPEPRSPLTTALHSLGLRALLRADHETVRELFSAFGRLGSRKQRWFLDAASPSYHVGSAMWGMWADMPVQQKAGMIAAVLKKDPRDHAGSSGSD
ncbi:lycopene cyclase family protein [Dietzia aurantiaca]|uniref:Lycopene cyclase family protein n=1 Tax=Dietzia aurantiaca TaxID=983873 RepID=A0ABV9PTQ8_9ACTN